MSHLGRFGVGAGRWPLVALCGVLTAVMAGVRLSPAAMTPVIVAGAVFALVAAWSQLTVLIVTFPLFAIIPPALQARHPDTLQVTLFAVFLAGFVLGGLDVDWRAPAFLAAPAGIPVAAVVTLLTGHVTASATLFGIGVAALVGGYLLAVAPARAPSGPDR